MQQNNHHKTPNGGASEHSEGHNICRQPAHAGQGIWTQLDAQVQDCYLQPETREPNHIHWEGIDLVMNIEATSSFFGESNINK